MPENTSDLEAKAAANQETVYQRVNDLIRAAFTKVIGANMAGGKWLGPSVTLAQPSTAATPAVGVVQPDGTTIEETSGGVISAGSPGGGVGGGGSLQAGANDVTIPSGDASGTTTVTFAIPYPTGSTPIVVATDPEVGYQGIIDESLVTNTDFVLGLGVTTGTVDSDTTKNVGWHAALPQLPGGPSGVPVIDSTLCGSTGVSIAPTISWSAVSGATSYEVQCSTDPTFATTEWDEYESGTSLTSPTLPTGTLFYVRARVVGPSYSAWGPTCSFTTYAVGGDFAGNFIPSVLPGDDGDGTYPYYTVAALREGLALGTGDWCIAGWFKSGADPDNDTPEYGTVFSGDLEGANVHIYNPGAFYGNAKVNCYSNVGAPYGPNTYQLQIGYAPSSYGFYDEGIRFFAVLRSGNTLQSYSDTSLISSVSCVTEDTFGVGATYFGGIPGAIPGTNNWQQSTYGALWNLAAWVGSAPSPSDLAAWVAAGPAVAPQSVMAHSPTNAWMFDEGTGTVAHDAISGDDATFSNGVPADIPGAYWTTRP